MYNNISPIFKWAGGKKKMLKKYEDHFKDLEINHFVDLFGGAGTMSYWIHKNFPKASIQLNERNPAIVSIFYRIKDDLDSLTKECNILGEEYLSLPRGACRKRDMEPGTRTFFYFKKRDLFNKKLKEDKSWIWSLEAASLIFFLMKTGFNGIWQGSSKTPYSTPHGNGTERAVFDWKAISDFREMLLVSDISCEDFRDLKIKEGFVYADPPYVDSFTKYSNSFGEDDTKDLIQLLNGSKQFAMSNKDHLMFRGGLEGCEFYEFEVKYTASRLDTDSAKCVEILAMKA